ncbi:hypothetical protein CHS0354_033030 [Potamilus streckersoni]|uniref:Uncharacterized protein n=1 Tax=Potamilus streckersoni TaxID=2493646 RepID=A0AAE0VKU1_9BIVA|nr:hypothetical protein CHS0354_033030 [Potamilus streckersoni]
MQSYVQSGLTANYKSIPIQCRSKQQQKKYGQPYQYSQYTLGCDYCGETIQHKNVGTGSQYNAIRVVSLDTKPKLTMRPSQLHRKTLFSRRTSLSIKDCPIWYHGTNCFSKDLNANYHNTIHHASLVKTFNPLADGCTKCGLSYTPCIPCHNIFDPLLMDVLNVDCHIHHASLVITDWIPLLMDVLNVDCHIHHTSLITISLIP